MTGQDKLIPKKAIIKEIVEMTPIEKLFKLEFVDQKENEKFTYKPGQFMMISVPGVGESPISICKSPTKPIPIELLIRKVGRVTIRLHKLKEGDIVGLRGPYGNGFPVEKMRGDNLLFVAGGLGIAPLRSVLQYALENKQDYGEIIVLYGVRDSKTMLFKDWMLQLLEKADEYNTRVFISYDSKDDVFFKKLREEKPEYIMHGLVTVLIDGAEQYYKPEKTSVVVCGPPVMYKPVLEKLEQKGFDPDKIYITVERRMKCGMGKCGQCVAGGANRIVYVCKDGPVFTYSEAKTIKGLI